MRKLICTTVLMLGFIAPMSHRGDTITFAAEKLLSETKSASGGSEAKSASGGGLVGYWRFEEVKGVVVKDLSGFGNDGKLFKAKRVKGKVGMALSFEDTGSYVKIPCKPSLNLGDAISIEAWIYPKDTSESRIIVSKNDEYLLRIDGAVWGNRITFFVHIGTPAVTWEPRVSSPGAPVLNTWYHVVGVWDGSKSLMYIDGKLVGERARVGKPNPNPYPIMIGNWEYLTCHGTNFAGLIDEVKIYNRALNAEEVKLHYEASGKE